MSGQHSFGSSFHPSNQSKRVSMGIVEDVLPAKRPAATKEDRTAKLATEKNTTGGKNNEKDMRAPEQQTSPWITTRGPHGAPIPTESLAGKSSIGQFTEGKCKTSDYITYQRKGQVGGKSAERVEKQETPLVDKPVVEDKTETNEKATTDTLRRKLFEILGTVASPKNQVPNSQNREAGANNLMPKPVVDKKFDAFGNPKLSSDPIETDSERPQHAIQRPVMRSSNQKKASTEKLATKNKIDVPSIYKQKHQEKGTASLNQRKPRGLQGAADGHPPMSMKKNEQAKILTEPPKRLFSENAQSSKVQQEKSLSETSPPAEKPSKKDAIETLKEPYRSRAPVLAEKTSSLGSKNKVEVPSNYRPKSREKKTDSLKQVRPWGLHRIADGLYSMSTKKSKPVKNVITPPKTCLSENAHSGKVQPETCLSETRLLIEEEASDKETDKLQKASYRSGAPLPAEKMTSFAENMMNTIGYPSENRRDGADPNSSKITKDWCHSSPYGLASPNISTPSSPFIIPEADETRKNVYSPQPERDFTMGNIFCSSLSSPNVFECHSGRKSHDEDNFSSPTETAATDTEEETSEDSLSESSFEVRDSTSSEESSPPVETFSRSRKRETSVEEAKNVAEKTPTFSRPSKRRCSWKEVKRSEVNTPSLKVTVESDWIEESPDDTQDNGLARAAALLALALEKFKRKMTSATSKRCSEILIAVTEGVRLQLQNVESQIQADMGQLTSLNKSKRKQLESRFEDLQEELTLMKKKFEQEVKRHLQDSKSIIEDLNAEELEFGKTVEERKESHQKLFSKVEEAVETELSDAQSRITAVQEMARKKMFQIKQAIAECLKDGILS